MRAYSSFALYSSYPSSSYPQKDFKEKGMAQKMFPKNKKLKKITKHIVDSQLKKLTWLRLTLTEAVSSTSSPGWWCRAGGSFVIVLRVIVHQVKVDTRFHDTLWLFPNWGTAAFTLKTRGRVCGTLVSFFITRITPDKRRPPPLGWTWTERGGTSLTHCCLDSAATTGGFHAPVELPLGAALPLSRRAFLSSIWSHLL